ncbi:MAG: endopeptidase La [Muribaculum sp.]|nr:endopeptidase La [Muribaculum sp.]
MARSKKDNTSDFTDTFREMDNGGGLFTNIEVPIDDKIDKKDVADRLLPCLPLRGMVIFEGIPLPLPIGRESSLRLCKDAYESKGLIVAVAQKDANIEDPYKADIYDEGMICRVVKLIEMPDGSHTAFLQSLDRFRVKRRIAGEEYLFVKGNLNPVKLPKRPQQKIASMMISVSDAFNEFLEMVSEDDTRELRFSLSQFDQNPVLKVNYICMNAPVDYQTKQAILEAPTFEERLQSLLFHLDQAKQLMKIKIEIGEKTHANITQQQRENFLQQQLNTIQGELGQGDDDDIRELQKRADSKKWNDDVAKHFRKELAKLGRLNMSNPEYNVQYGYLDTLLNLPWENYSDDEISLDHVEKILNRDHYGLEKVKERILEHMAVLKLRKDLKAPILCLFGPPGVGKTSLGKSVADALGREYQRISLGGVHDEAEIRGHRRTYIGAMPGRVLSALEKCGTSNPVIVLDEIDKIGSDHKGDPSTALLEVLDPEQNMKFHDNFVDVDYDLSKVLFLATANSLSTISAPLRDRMEIIDISGYITEEKVEIALRHLIPKELDHNGFSKNEISFQRQALKYIIESYTRESGVRLLEKTIAKVLRKIARLKASGKEYPTVVDKKLVRSLLGKEEVNPDVYENNDTVGVVTGLAWTSVGGEILFIESSLSEGKGALTMTGNLGDVMKESATLALNFLKAHCRNYAIDPAVFAKTDVHIHVPEGAIPKDGPSAGVTMITSLASSFTNRKVRAKLAMTGEITLRGKVLPVGGIKEKILAAKRAGITDIVLSRENRKDIEEINAKYLRGLTFHYVEKVEEVLDFALL